MKRYSTSASVIVAVGATFWAYVIMDELIRTFQLNVTWIDLGAIFILGLITGLSLALALRPGLSKLS